MVSSYTIRTNICKKSVSMLWRTWIQNSFQNFYYKKRYPNFFIEHAKRKRIPSVRYYKYERSIYFATTRCNHNLHEWMIFVSWTRIISCTHGVMIMTVKWTQILHISWNGNRYFTRCVVGDFLSYTIRKSFHEI